MAHSINSQGIAADGKLLLYGYASKALKTLDNWPETETTQPGYEKTLSQWTFDPDGANGFYVPDEAHKGALTITLTPTSNGGVVGESLSLTEQQWNVPVSQTDPGDGKPWLTDVLVSGTKTSGTVVTLSWTYHGPGTDATEVVVTLKVEEIVTRYAQYEIGDVRDICHNRGRYVWVKDGSNTFGVTDLDDESHPDRNRPFYSTESMPDELIGVESWRDLVVCFGTRTIEYFSLTGSSAPTDPIYMSQPSLMVEVGIAGTHCKCAYGDAFAIISHVSCGAPSVYIIDSGSKKPIATAAIEKILSNYPLDELATAVMETVRFEAHELLLIHLPRHVLCFDGAVSADGPQWCVLKSGVESDIYRGVDFLHDGGTITLGDKREPITGRLDFSLASQYGDATELLLYTPLVKADNTTLFDFEIESAAGLAQRAERLFLSATTDGSNYGREQLINSNDTFRYDARVLWRQVGRCRKNIGFRVRLITRTPASLALCQIRGGNG
ncbi:hypothetical protein E0L31_025150 [Serratia marcescens]|uniref:Uncharacterized protein n=2 Tax=Serratia marcescens TaxID=615 RepID=A0A9X8VD26_SERMA|nr:hypothetical protein [Serratia marcescens]